MNLSAISRVWLASLVLVPTSIIAVWPHSNCSQAYRLDKTIYINNHKIKAEVAKDYASQTKGLGGRDCISADQAMLFSFSRPGYYPFWMRDMKFPIDIVWLSADKQAVDFAPNVSPSSYPHSYVNSKPAQYVIELKAGEADKLKLTTGSIISF